MFLAITYHACIIHLNEVSLHEDFNSQDFAPPYTLDNPMPSNVQEPGSGHILAIMKCVSSSQALLEIFLAADSSDLCAMPSVMFVRMNYAIVVLFKVYVLTTIPEHSIAAVLDRSYLRVGEFLRKLHGLLSDLTHSLSFQGANRYLDVIERIQFSYATRQTSDIVNNFP